jgi:hypothetical protein
MITIGIIDDNAEQRDSFKDAIDIYLHKNGREGVEVIDSEPLADIDEYTNWIIQNDIAALIIDEKLTEQPLKATGQSCGYEGHDMAQNLRSRRSIIPIHVVTSSKINEDLIQNRELFENILSRKDFLDEQSKYAEIFIRSGQRFFEENQKLFERIGEISKKIVKNDVSDDEIKELEGIQQFIQTPLYSEEMMLRQDLIATFKNDLEELKKINQEAKDFLNS